MFPKISVIVPIYNAEKFIPECIESVLRQKFEDIELLLVNDGSTDQSGLICDQYAKMDNRIKVIHKENTGVSDTRNIALDSAIGDYVIFLDADDFWTDDTFLESFYNMAIEKELDVVRGEYKYVDQYGREHGKTKIPDARLKVMNDIIPSEIFLKDVILGEYFLVLSLIKREIVDDIRFNTSRVFLEDAEFYLTMLLKKLRCAYLPVVFYAYRKHAEAVTVRVHPQKLHDAFSFSSLCYNLAKKTDNGILKELLIIEGVKNYKFDLKAVAESKRSIEEIRALYKECKLSVTRKETIDSLKCLNNTYNQFICVMPVMLLIRYYRIIFCIKKQWHTIKSN